MKRIICGLVGLCLLAAAGPTSAQQTPSLAELAQKTRAQRKATKRPAKVYTNEDVPIMAPATAATATELSATPKEGTEAAAAQAAGGQAAAAGTQAGAAGGTQTGAAGGTKPGVAAGDEAKWRGRMTAAREALSRSQLQLEAMRSRVLHLQTAQAVGDPSSQQAVQRQQADALQEFDRLRADVERNRKALADLETEARAAGVPPGWLR